MSLPFFLEPNYPKPNESEMGKTIKNYIRHFGKNDLMTEAFGYTQEEWVRILRECVKENKTFWEYIGALPDSAILREENDVLYN